MALSKSPVFVLVCLASCFRLGQVLCMQPRDRASASSSATTDEPVCKTDGCQRAARYLLENIDFGANPCVDFYQFACGKYIREPPNRPDRSGSHTFQEAENNIKRRLDRLILDEHQYPIDNVNMHRVRTFYKSCMNQGPIGGQQVLELVRELGGMPLLGEQSGWNDATSGTDWYQLLGRLRRRGLDYRAFFGLNLQRIKPYRKEPRLLVVISKIDTSTWTEANESAHIARYGEILSAIDPNVNLLTSQVQFQLKRLYLFRMELNRIHNLIRVPDVSMSQQGLASKVQSIDWHRLFNHLLGPPIDPKAPVISNDIIGVIGLLINMVRPADLINHIMMTALETIYHDLMDPIMHGHEHCRHLTADVLNHAIASQYVRYFLNPDTRYRVLSIVEAMKRRLLRFIADADWIGTESKMRAIDRLVDIAVFVGHTDSFLYRSNVLDRFYNGLALDESQFLQNYLKLQSQVTVRMLERGVASPEEGKANEVDLKILTRQATYQGDNSIMIMSGFLQEFFFDESRPNYMNFATLGQLIAHELMHAFDPTHLGCTKTHNDDRWWDDQTEKVYKKRLLCLVKQYDQVDEQTIGYKLDSVGTIVENFPDNFGLAIAHQAYLDWSGLNPSEPKLPGFENLPTEQLFWISYGALLCNRNSRDDIRNQYMGSEHAPPSVRANVPVSNMVAFSEAFRCSLGLPMNPVIKCPLF